MKRNRRDHGVMALELRICMGKFVFDRLDDIAAKDPAICKCEICGTDIAALALNRLKPCYVSTDKSDTYTRLQLYEKDSENDITRATAEAIRVVNARPGYA